LRITEETSAPGATVDRTDHDVLKFIDCAQARRDDDAL
jgi:hypothetical protein